MVMQHTLDLAFVDTQLNIIFTKLLSALSTVRANIAVTLAFQTSTWLCKSMMNEIIKNNTIFWSTSEYMIAFNVPMTSLFSCLGASPSAFALIVLDYI